MRKSFRTIRELAPAVLLYILSSLFGFIKKLFGPFLLAFGAFGIAFYGAAILIPDLLLNFTQIPYESILLIKRILLTLAPIGPTFYYAAGCVQSTDEESDDLSMDFCFFAWILTAVYAWKIL